MSCYLRTAVTPFGFHYILSEPVNHFGQVRTADTEDKEENGGRVQQVFFLVRSRRLLQQIPCAFYGNEFQRVLIKMKVNIVVTPNADCEQNVADEANGGWSTQEPNFNKRIDQC